MDKNLIVIDNFLDDPDKIRHIALSFDYDRYDERVPGVRSTKGLGGSLKTEIESKLSKALNGKVRWYWKNDTFCFQSCKEGTETYVHKDTDAEWAAVLYLTPDAPIDSGTGIYDGVDGDMNIAVGNKYNRLVAYRGRVLYHRSILPGFGDTLETSRLTQVFFFDIDGQE
jgi:hypothetical protein|tara:strand:- start:1526 stop:2032 length:507 start_codon:yes stop_codon:yes gene_type:complete